MVLNTTIANARPFAAARATAADSLRERLVRENANLRHRALQAENQKRAVESALKRTRADNEAAHEKIKELTEKIVELTNALAAASMPKKQKKEKKPLDREPAEKPPSADDDKSFKVEVPPAYEDAYKVDKDDGTSL